MTEEVKEHLEYQAGELLVLESFDDIRQSEEDLEMLVKWQGVSDSETDWVPYDSLKEDVPKLLHEYIQSLKKTGTTNQKSLVHHL